MIDLFDVILALENTYVFFEKDVHVFPETRTCFFGNNEKLPDRREKLEACDPKEIFSDEVNRIIHKTLKNLPEQTHRIFEMSRFENKTVKEIADETNLTIKGVEYHITKALKALRINLKDYLPLFYFLFS